MENSVDGDEICISAADFMTADMTGILKKFYHIVAFSWYAFVIQSIFAKRDSDLPPGIFVYGGPWKYLTFLNLVRYHQCEGTLHKRSWSFTLLEVACKFC